MKCRYIFLFLLFPLLTKAQQIITVQDAIGTALKNNYGLLVANNNVISYNVNNTAGNAGMLPTVSLTGNGSYSSNNVTQKYSGSPETKYSPLNNNSMNGGIELSWKLFDGGKMFITRSRLKEMVALGDIQYRETVLQTMFSVIAAYYNIVREKQQLSSVMEVMNYNQERVIIAQAGVNAGSMVRTDLLQAQIDLNIMKENVINQNFAIAAAKRSLALLLAKNPLEDYDVVDSIPHDSLPDKQVLFQRLDTVNTTILAWQKELEIAQLGVKEANASYWPTLNMRAGYYVSNTSNSTGNLLASSSMGPQAGVTLSVPIFSAGEIKRKANLAKIQTESTSYNLEDIKLGVIRDLQDAYTSYENQLQVLQIERENNKLARENLEISIHRLRLGQTTSLEVHQAADNFVQSSTRLINFEYNLKVSEIKLRQLISSL